MQLSEGVPLDIELAHHGYQSAQRSDDAIQAWRTFRALCRQQDLDPVEIARLLNPWRKL
jgi:hypothetical protein